MNVLISVITHGSTQVVNYGQAANDPSFSVVWRPGTDVNSLTYDIEQFGIVQRHGLYSITFQEESLLAHFLSELHQGRNVNFNHFLDRRFPGTRTAILDFFISPDGFARIHDHATNMRQQFQGLRVGTVVNLRHERRVSRAYTITI